MKQLTLEMPDHVLAATRQAPEEFLREMRVTAAIAWYVQGKLSQETAARMAGLDRVDFLLALARNGVDSFPVKVAELAREIEA